ncbi:MAG TPA: ABC transporter ATP-binding protein [Glycomyces sp.]|nr:ABC transporter ATP-binding protein [Glycomyces sp.]
MSTYAVMTRDLTRSFGAATAVDGVDIEVRPGEIYGFLGANGAGKTTTMRMLLGLTAPTRGRATVLGRPAGDPKALARTGVLIEEPALYPYLSGRDNLRAMGRYTAVSAERVEQVLETVGLTDAAERRVATYSLGMRQRLGVGMALLKDPELLVLDEPTNGLDPAGVVHMRNMISSFAAEGRTVLLSSHALGEVDQICDRVGVLADGRLVAQGSVAEIRGEGALLVHASPTPAAADLLGARFGRDNVHLDPGGIAVRVDPALAATVNRVLVEAGLEVSALAWRERTLTDSFFELTAATTGSSR